MDFLKNHKVVREKPAGTVNVKPVLPGTSSWPFLQALIKKFPERVARKIIMVSLHFIQAVNL
jgi:hypothetical protein